MGRLEVLAKQEEIEKIILREKDLSEEAYEALAVEAKKLCGDKLVIHGFFRVAVKLGIRKIHLPLGILQSLSDDEKAYFEEIGSSVHSQEESSLAQDMGCTYLVAGHIFATDCKKGVPERGLSFLRMIVQNAKIPVYAIGGIGPENIASCVREGAAGVCIMSGLMTCRQPEKYMDRCQTFDMASSGHRQRIGFDKKQLLLYAVTDCPKDRELIYEKAKQALEGGITILQLRLKNAASEEVVDIAQKLLPLCHSYRVPLIINDDPEAAYLSGADGVHVGLEDMSVSEIRQKYGSDMIIGATAKTIEQAQTAQKQGADYLGCGAVFPSPTKQNAIRITNEQLNEISDSVTLPTVAIGGISEQNALSLMGSHIDGIAVVSALFSAEDTEKAACRLRAIAEQITENTQ